MSTMKTALIAGLFLIANSVTFAQPNVIKNGSFDGDSIATTWSTFLANWDGGPGTAATFSVVDGVLNITDVSNAIGETWYIQFNQLFTAEQIAALEVGATYELSFDAASDLADRPLKIYFGEDGGSYTTYISESVALSTEMATYTLEGEITALFSAIKLGFEAGNSNGNVMLDNIALYKKSGGSEPIEIPIFGDNRILFVEGPNLETPQIGGSVVKDPSNDENKVHKIEGGAWFQAGYFWDLGGKGGVDFSENMTNRDTVYFRLRINPADHFSDDTGDRRTGALWLSDVTNGTNSDLQWGIAWKFPEDAYDNQWHEYAIPLPKPTIAAHDSALKGLDLDGNPLADADKYNSELQKQWFFHTAWNGSMDVHPNDEELGGDPEWNKLGRIAIALGNDRSGAFYLDDFFIGSKAATDLNVALELPDEPAGLTVTAEGDSMKVSWAHDENSNIYAYELFYSGTPITNVDNEGVVSIGTYLAKDATSFTHEIRSPHPGDASHEYFYAVAPTSVYSIKDPTLFADASEIATGEMMPYIFEIDEATENTLLSAIDAGEIGDFAFSDNFKPFILTGSSDDESWGGLSDASAKVWMAFGRAEGLNTVYILAEVLDDDILAGPASNPSEMYGTTIYPRNTDATTWIPTINNQDTDLEWNYYLKDQLKFNFGTYGVNFVSGTPNKDRARGEKPDYFLSLQPFIDPVDVAAGPVDMLLRFWVTEPNTTTDADYNTLYYTSNQLFTYSSVFENILDGESRVGWRALVAFDASDLLVVTDDLLQPVDALFEFPGVSEIKYIPMMIELSDKDSGDIGNWWEVPSHVLRYPTAIGGARMEEWTDDLTGIGTVAMAGAEVSTSNETEIHSLPESYELDQNYPNPFNPSTTIRFSLPQSSTITLNVYNVVGQRVATLVNNRMYAAGVHRVQFDASSLSSGLYIYELRADGFRSTKQMMLIK